MTTAYFGENKYITYVSLNESQMPNNTVREMERKVFGFDKIKPEENKAILAIRESLGISCGDKITSYNLPVNDLAVLVDLNGKERLFNGVMMYIIYSQETRADVDSFAFYGFSVAEVERVISTADVITKEVK